MLAFGYIGLWMAGRRIFTLFACWTCLALLFSRFDSRFGVLPFQGFVCCCSTVFAIRSCKIKRKCVYVSCVKHVVARSGWWCAWYRNSILHTHTLVQLIRLGLGRWSKAWRYASHRCMCSFHRDWVINLSSLTRSCFIVCRRSICLMGHRMENNVSRIDRLYCAVVEDGWSITQHVYVFLSVHLPI
jgi:hypothetical protein